MVQLRDICSKIGSGATPRGGANAYLGGDFSLIRSQNILDYKFSDSGLVKINDEQADALSNVEVFENDVLLNITGDSVARCCQVDNSVLPARVNQHVCIVRPDEKTLHSKFLKYFFLNPIQKEYLLMLASSGATRNALTKGMIEDLEFPNISYDLQKAIAHILGTLDDKIELNQKMNETLEKIAKAIFKSWFVDFDPVRAKMEGRPTGLPDDVSDLFPDELVDSEIGEIPKGWEVDPLGSVFSIQYGKNLPTKSLIEDGYPVFGGNGVIGFHSAYLYEEVMTLIACRGAASGKAGRSLPKSFVTNNSLVINHEGAELTSQRFIEFSLESGDPENYVTGSAQPQLTIDNIKNFPFMTPPSQVVDFFEGIVHPIAGRQLILNSENQILSELRDTLLPKLISGELQIPDAENFLEEAGI